MVWKVSVVVVLASLAVAVSAYAGVAHMSATTNVAVTAGKPTEFRFTLSKKSVVKGKVVFKVTNKGTLTHDFRISGKTSKMLRPGTSTTLTIAFKKAGKYAFLCTVPGHAAGGMKGVLTVK